MNEDNIKIKWWAEGLAFGFLMFIGISILSPLITGEGLVLKQVLFGIPVWGILGLCYGKIVHFLRLRNKE